MSINNNGFKKFNLKKGYMYREKKICKCETQKGDKARSANENVRNKLGKK